ncbi:MAG: leucyl aminopeptidase [Anaerolineae bacterium]
MDIKAVSGRIEMVEADAIILSFIEGTELSEAATAVDAALNGVIKELLEGGDFAGKAEQMTVLYPHGVMPARRVILVGLGKLDTLTADGVRRAAAAAILKARELKANKVASQIHGAVAGGLPVEAAAQAVTEGSLLALYSFRGQKTTGEAPPNLPTTLELLTGDAEDVQAVAGVSAGSAIAAGVRLTRDLVNQPPNVCTPEYLANAARDMAQAAGLSCIILDREQMAELKMGALLAVAQGSDAPPQFIILEHNAGRSDVPAVVLVGKGVTFDTGGYDMKTIDGMSTMKGDMAGGAAVIGAMQAIASLKPNLHVVGLVPTADNMINGHAYRPSDILTASNGLTIEIISTDAEGRLLLADALVYAGRYKPAAVVDIATLTGSCVTALGANVSAGLFSSDDGLRDRLMMASGATAEKLWPLPLFPEYDKTIESPIADLKNSGGARGGVGTSAIFLKHFADYPAWAHIDMAGMTFDQPNSPYTPKGATGYGVRLMVEFVRRWGG